jgi:hypothetical protein
MKKSTIAVVGLAMALFLTICPAFGENWHVPGDFDTIQQAIDSYSVVAGDKILIGSGRWLGATVNKPVEMEGEDGAVIIGGLGGPYAEDITCGLKLVAGSTGAIISHLQFEEVKIGIAGYNVTDVIVTQCTFIKNGQGLLTFGVSGWKITHNTIRDPQFVFGTTAVPRRGGGGITMIARATNETCTYNIIEHNKITGIIENKGLPFTGTATTGGVGISLMRQTQNSSTPGQVSQNMINYNNVELVLEKSLSDLGVPVRGFLFNDLQPATNKPGINNNTISFNDFRGTRLSITTPVPLTTYDVLGSNIISRNLGGSCNVAGTIVDCSGVDNNRGHGVTTASSLKP